MPIAETSAELWESLRTQAGLTVSAPGKPAAYDDTLMDALKSELFGERPEAFEDLLEAEPPALERLLEAFLLTLAPFSRMMSDILVMFEAAAARRSDRNLRIRIDAEFNPAGLDFDLYSFRETVERLERAVVLRRRRMWHLNNAWSLSSLLADHLSADFRRSQEPHDPATLAWLAEMGRDHDFPMPPRPVLSGVEALDDLTAELWADFRSFQAASRRVTGRYSRVRDLKLDGSGPSGWSADMLKEAAHDRWPSNEVRWFAFLAEALRDEPESPDLERCVTELRQQVEAITSPPQPVEDCRSVLSEVLALPVWKQRSELYSVWIASVLTKHLQPYGVEFQITGGVLAFPFRKQCFAKVGADNEGPLELWSELRTPGENLLGRKNAIQPDYRLRFPSGEETGEADLLVVECKQYKVSSPGNFSKAITDYGRATTSARIVLTNYGPVLPSVLERVDPEVAGRADAIGDVQPGGRGLEPFAKTIQNIALAVFGTPPEPQATGLTMLSVDVALAWQGHGVDLDLHVKSARGACSYRTPNGLGGARFHGDNRGAVGDTHRERISLTPQPDDEFEVVVAAYAGVSAIGDADPVLTLTWRPLDGPEQSACLGLRGAVGGTCSVARIKPGTGLVEWLPVV